MKYANGYLDERLWQLEKDIGICLAGRRSDDDSKFEHAYFPALMTCCGMLELFANLYSGESRRQGPARFKRLDVYRRFLPSTGYSNNNVRILFGLLRNSIAHHGTADGVWKDSESGRRITWMLATDNRRPALELVPHCGELINDSFEPCPYTHRLRVRLDRLWRDIVTSVESPTGFRNELNSKSVVVEKFHRCMGQVYPKAVIQAR